MTGFFRNLKWQLQLLWESAGICLATSGIFYLFLLLSTPISQLSRRAPMMGLLCITAVGIILSAAVFGGYYFTYAALILSMSSTRRASFWGLQAAKPLWGLLVAGIAVLFNGAACLLWPESEWLLSGRLLLLAVLLICAVISIGEVLGLVSRRWGKLGGILLGLFVGIGAAGGGILAGLSGDDRPTDVLERILTGITAGQTAFFALVLLLVTAVLSAASGLLYKKFAV